MSEPVGNLLPCRFCGKPPGTKVGPPAMARCVTDGCQGKISAAHTFPGWNERNQPAPLSSPVTEQPDWSAKVRQRLDKLFELNENIDAGPKWDRNSDEIGFLQSLLRSAGLDTSLRIAPAQLPAAPGTVETGDDAIKNAALEAVPGASIANIVRSDGDLLVYYAGFNLSKFVRFLALRRPAQQAPNREVSLALAEIRTIALAGWSNNYDQDFGTKDEEYRFDCIREQVERALKSLPSVTSTPGGQAWCEHCGSGNDTLGYRHLDTCGRAAVTSTECAAPTASSPADSALSRRPHE